MGKKHHYVPRFYLKHFAADPKGNSLRMLLVNELKWQRQVNLYNQCQREHLYGKGPELESWFEHMETRFSRIIRRMIHDQYIPVDYDLVNLYMFAHLSRARLPGIQQDLETMAAAVANKVAQMNFGANAPKLSVSLEGVFDEVVRRFVRSVVLYHGLKPLLVESQGMDFVTSDNPVVLHNQFYWRHKHVKSLGLPACGLQVFIPLSSRWLLVLHDPEIYSATGQVLQASDQDVQRLNELQVLNCKRSVYFSSLDTMSQLSLRYATHESRNHQGVQVRMLDHPTDPLRKYMLTEYVPHIPDVPLSFLKLDRRKTPDFDGIRPRFRFDPLEMESYAHDLERRIRQKTP